MIVCFENLCQSSTLCRVYLRYVSVYRQSTQPTMSAKSPWNAQAVVGIFYPRPFFAAKIAIVSPLPPLYNVESIVEVLSYLEKTSFLPPVLFVSPSNKIVLRGRGFCCSSTA